MTKKKQMLLNIIMIIVSWISIPLVGKKTLVRFFPATIFSIVLCSLDLQIGKKRKWWKFYNNPKSTFLNEMPFLIGPMLVTALVH